MITFFILEGFKNQTGAEPRNSGIFEKKKTF